MPICRIPTIQLLQVCNRRYKKCSQFQSNLFSKRICNTNEHALMTLNSQIFTLEWTVGAICIDHYILKWGKSASVKDMEVNI